MLLTQQDSAPAGIAIITRNPRFTALLSQILRLWKYPVTATAETAAVLLIERGLAAPATRAQIVWLVPMPLPGELSFETPLSLTALYHFLEVEFYPSPRQHIRVALDEDVDLAIEGGWLAARLISLSDRGGRLDCPGELPRGQKLELVMQLDRQMLRLPAEVLYCIPAGDLPGHQQPQLGIQFKPIDAKVCTALRSYIERLCVEAACRAADVSPNDPCLSWIELNHNPWAELS